MFLMKIYFLEVSTDFLKEEVVVVVVVVVVTVVEVEYLTASDTSLHALRDS